MRRHQPQGQLFVFVNRRGRPWTKSALDLRLYRMRQRLGINPQCKLYGCRHDYATELAIGGIDVASLAELLGHTSWNMSAHYVHASGKKEHLLKALKNLGRLP
jgi:integrase/recombinase XerD